MQMMMVKSKIKYISYMTIALCILIQGAFAFTNNHSSKSWKVLVYMQADNDLAPYAMWDLAEMEKGLVQSKNVRVFTELDLPGDEGSYRLEVLANEVNSEQNLTYYKNLSLSQINSRIITVTDESISQEEKLLDFVLWAQETHPTDHTMLVIWGHGEGWSYSQLAQYGGVALDDNPISKLSVNKIRDIIKSAKMITNSQLNFLSMDACLMQTVEVAHEFSEVVEYVSGSTQIQNFRGLPYTNLIISLESKTPYRLAQTLPELYKNALETYATNKDKRNATISVVNVKELDQTFNFKFNEALMALTDLLEERTDYKLTLSYKLKQTPAFLGNSRDLSNFIGEIQKFLLEKNELRTFDLFNEALYYLKSSVVSYAYGDQYLNNHDYYLGYFRAFGVWFPGDNMDFQNRKQGFEKSRFYQKVPAWGDFLFEFYRPIKPIFILKGN